MRTTRRTVALIICGITLSALPLTAQQPHGKGPKPKAKVVVVHPSHRFRANDHVTFRNYYRDHRLVVTPLRPEVARLVVVGKPLPPGIAKRGLAPEVLVLAPPPAPHYSYAIVGNRLVLLNDRGVVADIIDGIF